MTIHLVFGDYLEESSDAICEFFFYSVNIVDKKIVDCLTSVTSRAGMFYLSYLEYRHMKRLRMHWKEIALLEMKDPLS